MSYDAMADAEGYGHDAGSWATGRPERVRPRHLRPHATFGDDPSGSCGCAGCDPRDDCACRSCKPVIERVDRYNITVDGRQIRATPEQEASIRRLDRAGMNAFKTIMGIEP